MKQSNFLSLGWRDLLHAFAVAAISFLLNFAQEVFIPSLNISQEFKATIIAGIAYLTKKFFSKPETE